MKRHILILIVTLFITVTGKAQNIPQYLPSKLEFDLGIISFSYDNRNRFVEIVNNHQSQGVRVDSIFYKDDNTGICYKQYFYETMEDLKNKHPLDVEVYNYLYTENTEKRLSAIQDGDKIKEVYSIEFDDSGYLKSFVIDDNRIDFTLDEQGNPLIWHLTGNRWSGYYPTLQDIPLLYDNKNGIFKNVNKASISYSFNPEIPFLLFMHNNIRKIGNDDKDSFHASFDYEYLNESGYPVLVKSTGLNCSDIKVEYIEAR